MNDGKIVHSLQMMENCYGNGLHERLNSVLPKISQKTHIKIPSLLLFLFFLYDRGGNTEQA
jgi:hypothetical protein